MFNTLVNSYCVVQNLPLPDNEPDPLIPLLPLLRNLSTLLQTCRFPAFWKSYHSEELSALRENYTVEYAGFDDSVREVAVRAVRATFETIGKERLGRYLNLTGVSITI